MSKPTSEEVAAAESVRSAEAAANKQYKELEKARLAYATAHINRLIAGNMTEAEAREVAYWLIVEQLKTCHNETKCYWQYARSSNQLARVAKAIIAITKPLKLDKHTYLLVRYPFNIVLCPKSTTPIRQATSTESTRANILRQIGEDV